jgi:hypothetical protein
MNPVTIKVTALIRKNDTGEIREYQSSLPLDCITNQPLCYLWEEGNFSCDCNRELLFYDHEIDDTSCSNNRFDVNIVLDDKIIYKEF